MGIFAALGGVTLLATNDATPGIAFLTAGVFGIAAGIRCFQVRLVIASRDLAAHNVFRVRRTDLSTVAAVDVARRKQGEAGTNWFARLRLVDGRTFWIDALDLGGTKMHPSKEGFDLVEELRRRLNVGGVSNSRRDA